METRREVVLTSDGLRKMEDELDRLKHVERRRLADRLREAMDSGDELSENADYEYARNEMAYVEGRIEELRDIIGAARLVDDVNTDQVGVGCKVRLEDLENGDELIWSIVGTFEADPAEDKISNESPVGMALMGAKVGEVVGIKIPAGRVEYKVLDITK